MMTFNIMAFGLMTILRNDRHTAFSIVTFGILTFNIMAFGIMTAEWHSAL
jgi:hypothetical protein